MPLRRSLFPSGLRLAVLVGVLGWACSVQAATTVVNVQNFTFTPATVTINPGDAIQWHFINGMHTTTSGTFVDGPDGLWDAPIDVSNQNFTRTFSASGIFNYYCQFHGAGGMVGTITVSGASCTLDGSALVCPNTSGLTYTVTTNPRNGTYVFAWSISGNGVIVGSTTGSSVSVTSGGAGSFILTMNATRNGVPLQCTRVVTVSAATTCTLTGSSPVATTSTGNVYTSSVSPAGGTVTYSWSIAGNGTITSATNTASATVTAGAVGSFTLTLNVIRDSCPGSCQKVVTVIAPTCSISGPSPVLTGSIGNSYTSAVSPSGGTVTYSWSISGNGTITSATNTASATVTAGAAGSFTLTLNGSRDGVAFQCQKIVTVNPLPTCVISGADTVVATSTGNGYTVSVSPIGGTVVYSWSISGNGTITSATNTASATVTAGAPGSFTLTQNGTRDGVAFQCQKTVTVKAGAAAIITASDFQFSPPNVVINQGQSVEWVWGNGMHTTTNGVSSDPLHNPGSLWDAPLDVSHTSFTFQFNTPGYYPFFCRIHEADMKGSVQVQGTSGVGNDSGVRFRLLPSPNPFSSKVDLHFTLDRDTRVVLEIFDLGGRKVLSLLTADLPMGEHQVTWGGWNNHHQPVVPGVYFARLETGDGRMKVLKLFKSR
jgi:plastocyanin